MEDVMAKPLIFVSSPCLPAARAVPTIQRLGYRAAVVVPFKPDPSKNFRGEGESVWAQHADSIFTLERPADIGAIEEVMRIAVQGKAEIFHAMWGPNSEEPTLVEACASAGILFCGSAAAVMQVAGHKPATRNMALQAGVPILQGTESITNFNPSAEFLERLGFPGRPLMVKGTNTGGGRMIYPVRTMEELEKYMRQCRDALEMRDTSASSVFLEQMAENPQHIEAQGAMDRNGDIAILGLRVCSIQEMRAKRIEEVPRATQIVVEKRKEIEGYAERILHYLAKNVGFGCVLTMEFLVDCHGNVYFLEINPRVQVEHRVTEFEYDGLDMIELSILLSLGYPLKEILPSRRQNRHVIEARVYVWFKDEFVDVPYVNFPFTPGVHVDCMLPGYVVSFLTPHIANIVVQGESPEDAICRMQDYLDEVAIGGTTKEGLPIETNLWKLKAWMGDPDFRSGGYTTKFVEKFSSADLQHAESRLRGELFTRRWAQGRVDPAVSEVRYPDAVLEL